MSNYTVTQVYEFVVDSVVNRSRKVFEEMGFSETVLETLQKGWEDKIGLVRQTSSKSSMQMASSSSSSSESSASQTSDPGTMHEPVQATAEITVEQVGIYPAPAPATPAPVLARPPSPYSALLLSLKPEAPPDVNQPNVISNAAPLSGVSSQIEVPELPVPVPAPNRRKSTRLSTPTRTSSSRTTRNSSKTSFRRSPRFRQTDGASVDDIDLEISDMTDLDEQHEDAPGEMSLTLTLSKKAANKARRTELGPLERETIGQYDKIDKTSKTGKWKLHLTYGLMSINNSDYLFKEARGDCEWLDGPKWTS
ncbi:hypothetical protein BG000_006311 [Podila horticola]|nr:hypothetical protein BG000_006311 [Podila horticola]